MGIGGIADLVTRARMPTRITSNVDKMWPSLFGDWQETGAGVFEMRMDFGPGYRGRRGEPAGAREFIQLHALGMRFAVARDEAEPQAQSEQDRFAISSSSH